MSLSWAIPVASDRYLPCSECRLDRRGSRKPRQPSFTCHSAAAFARKSIFFPVTSRQHGLDAGEFAKVDQRGIQISSVAQARVLVRPALQHSVDLAMNGNKPVRPKANATLIY